MVDDVFSNSFALLDANLFKDAFLKAQKENEVIFGKEGGEANKPE